MSDLLDITHKVLPVSVIGSGLTSAVEAYTDGQHYYFDDANITRVGEHLSGRLDLAGRPVVVQRSGSGWDEQRGRQVRPLHQRHINGRTYFRFDDEWLFSVVAPPRRPQPQRSS